MNVTDDRQTTDDRLTDRRTMTYSEHEREFTFAKKSYSTYNFAHCKSNANSHMIHVNVNSYCLEVNYCSRFFSSHPVHHD